MNTQTSALSKLLTWIPRVALWLILLVVLLLAGMASFSQSINQ